MVQLSQRSRKASASLLILLFAAGFLFGGLVLFYFNYQEINSLNRKVGGLQGQISTIAGSQNVSIVNQTVTVYQNATSLADIYANTRDSIVVVQGEQSTGGIQGSGFVYLYSGRDVVITNFHVVYQTTNLTVSFTDGNTYPATVLGTDPYADLGVVSVSAPGAEFKPLEVVSSSSLRVGEEVVAIGNPYGQVGSLTTGVVSALGRTIQEDYTNFAVANIIQTSTPINPGNSGGPLLNSVGKVVGITTAIISGSQGLGFAVPSDTILKEIVSLITTGTYSLHSYLGIMGTDMSYTLARQLGVNVTYGWEVNQTVSNGPSDGKLQPADVIIAMNGTTIKNQDDLASYLEAKTLPGEHLVLTVVRNNATITVNLTLGTRPTPNL